MVRLEDAVIVHLKTRGENYEIYVDADKALKYRGGEDIPLEEVLAVNHVFKDAAKGEKASEEHLMELFQVKDVKEAIKEVLTKGELHLTTEQKRKMHEDRKKQVASIIARNAINPQTHAPHPLTRIEAAMEEARVDITINKSANEQVEKVLKALKPLIPIKFEKLQVAVKIPATFAAKMYHPLREIGEIKKEEWVGGELICLIEIPAGLQDELYNKLNSLTHGEVKTKVVKHE
ncbi:MAG: ribosome assembly factor SBDS [Candidatus Altiarchaeota archaeon]